MLEQPGQMDLIYHIKEGNRYRVGKINVVVKGENPHTQTTTILNRLSIKPGDIVDMRQVHESERRIKLSGLFENKPGTGPRIIPIPPGQEALEEEDGNPKGRMAERPGGRSKLPGQGPDPQAQGAMVSAVERSAAAGAGTRSDGRLQRLRPVHRATEPLPPQAVPAQPTASGPASQSGSVWPAFGQPVRETQASAAIVRCQSPDDSQPISLRNLQNGGASNPGQNPLSKALSDLSNAISPKRREPAASNWQPQYVQYTPDPGQSTPQLSRPTNQWTAVSAAPVGSGVAATTQAASAAQTSAGPTWNASGAETTQPAPVQPAPQYGQAYPQNSRQPLLTAPNGDYSPGPIFAPDSPFNGGPPDGGEQAPLLDFSVLAEEAMTGRVMFGVGINSDSGLVGQATIDEQNFDWSRFPTSWEDIRNGTALRRDGQHFRFEAMPGTQRIAIFGQLPRSLHVQHAGGPRPERFLLRPHLHEYTDQRLGGRVSLGYAVHPRLDRHHCL